MTKAEMSNAPTWGEQATRRGAAALETATRGFIWGVNGACMIWSGNPLFLLVGVASFEITLWFLNRYCRP